MGFRHKLVLYICDLRLLDPRITRVEETAKSSGGTKESSGGIGAGLLCHRGSK